MNLKSRVVGDYIMILLGSIVMSLSLVWFLNPHKVAAGGVSGIGVVLYHLFHFPIGVSMLAFNIPLFLLGVRFLGKQFGIRTLFGMFAFSITTDFFDKILHWGGLTDNPLLATLYGGVLMGVGLGMVFRSRGSTGGSDIVAQIFSQKGILSAGNTFMLIDFVVISGAGLCFKGINYALWGFIALYVSSKIIDIIIAGLGYAKACYIISDYSEDIRDKIFERMNRGVTFLKSQGGYSRKDRNIILCIVTRREVAKIRDIVREIDGDAFVIIEEVNQVMGEGFRSSDHIA